MKRGCIGCFGLIVIVVVIGALLGGPSEEKVGEPHSVTVDLAAVRERLQREIDSTEQIEKKVYRIHELEFDGRQITLIMDLQFCPESGSFLAQDGKAWTDMVLYAQSEGSYIKDLSVNVRTSLWTVFSPDEVLSWGDYRYFSGVGQWSPNSKATALTVKQR